MATRVVHFDVPIDDPERAGSFYRAVFGWSYDDQDMGTMIYHVIAGGESGGLGAIMPMPPEMPDQVPNHWGVYFTITDLDATVAAVTSAGGQIVAEPMDIPGVGRRATVHDPTIASFSLMQPAD